MDITLRNGFYVVVFEFNVQRFSSNTYSMLYVNYDAFFYSTNLSSPNSRVSRVKVSDTTGMKWILSYLSKLRIELRKRETIQHYSQQSKW